MVGPTHRMFGALAGATYGSVTGQHWTGMAVMALAASATSNGPFSPDMDQTGPWQKLSKSTRLVGVRGWFRHRHGLSHWWALPFIAWWGVGLLPPETQWAVITIHALIIGWASHLLGDLIFGELSLFPWGGPSWGIGLKTDGILESGKFGWFTLPFGPTRVAIAVALVAVFWLNPSMPTIPIPDLITAAKETL
ncbi:MAG: hypothetical protein GX643_13700 [Acidimicrobiales bacterium]|nr:hypothetical protein [Acidimicrobiales bacterium]